MTKAQVRVRNQGSGPITLERIEQLEGSPTQIGGEAMAAPIFTIDLPGELVLEGGDVRSLDVSFAPAQAGAFMSKLAASEFSATRYAVLSSIYALPGHLLAGGSGFVASATGYPVYFTLTFLSGLPALLFCLVLREERASSRPERSEEPGSPAERSAG